MSSMQALGVAFALGQDGSRSTTLAGAQILAAALEPLDPAAARAALAETRWRRTYPQHFCKLVEGGLPHPDLALASAKAGLAAAWRALRWESADGPSSLSQALAHPGTELRTLRLQGQGDPAVAPWSVPLRGEQLRGEGLRTQLADWEHRGIIEPSAARAFERCMAHPEWFDLSDRTLVLMGAGSEAGPLRWLARWRANIVAVDIPRRDVWQRIAPETTNALMAALWVHDLRHVGAAADPATPLAHPFELFMDNACHGGLWTMAYRPRSALPVAAALGWVRQQVGRHPQ